MDRSPKLDLVYYGTGNPGVWNPDLRPGDDKWGATIFARDPRSGDAVWAYQVTPGSDISNLQAYVNVAGTSNEPTFLQWWAKNPKN